MDKMIGHCKETEVSCQTKEWSEVKMHAAKARAGLWFYNYY